MLRMPVLVISRQPWIALSFTINCFEEIQTVSGRSWEWTVRRDLRERPGKYYKRILSDFSTWVMCVISWSLFVTVASLLASFAVRGTTSRWIRLDKEYWWHFISGLIYSDTEPMWGNVVIDILEMFVGVKYLFSRSFPEERDFFCIKKSIGFSNSLISWCKICAWYKPTSVQWRNKATSHFTSLQFYFPC